MFNIGDKVTYNKNLKSLDYDSVGIITYISKDYTWVTIKYPQNSAYDDDDKGGWKPRKNAPNKVFAHSANIEDITIIN